MRKARPVFGFLAAVGFALSAAVHLSTFVGVDPIDLFPPVWLLHIGIFVVIIPAAAWCTTSGSAAGRPRPSPFTDAPGWMGWMVGALFAYALVNFAIFLFLVWDGSPSRRPDGSFALTSHGRLVREVSEEEFHRYQAYVARGFSGHWMLFYGFALAALASGPRRADGHSKSEG